MCLAGVSTPAAEARPYTISTLAGDGSTAYAGDGGPAINAKLRYPRGVAVMPNGGVVVTDTDNDVVRLVEPSGIISTIAGTGVTGFSGDGGPATNAQFVRPTGIAVAPDGSVIIADTQNHRVRRIAPSGTITTVAGSSTAGYSGDGGPATAAQLNFPRGVTVAPDGAILIADLSNHRIRRVDAGGTITTVAGNGMPGFSGDLGAATAAQLNAPSGVALGPDGSLVIADSGNHRIRRINAAEDKIFTIAGTGTAGSAGDGGPATAAKLGTPSDVVVAPDFSIVVADNSNYRVREISPGGSITTIAGTGVYGYSGDGGLSTDGALTFARGVDLMPDGRVVFADTDNGRVRLLTPVRFALGLTLAGSGAGTVTSAPAGITCPADCDERYDASTVVSLAASPVMGSAFGGWSGACLGAISCVVTMSEAREVTATFNALPPGPRPDGDGDGADADDDCNDADPAIGPAAKEKPGNATDENCDGRAAPFKRINTVIQLTWLAERGGRTRVVRLVAEGVRAGDVITLRCRTVGKGCRTTADRRLRVTTTPKNRRLVLTRFVKGLSLRPGAELWVTIDRADHVTRSLRYTMRARGVPRKVSRCIAPGATRSRPC